MSAKKKILFVGSFIAPSDGRIGGQYFASKSLIESDLAKVYNFVKVDSTIDSIRVGSVFLRLHKVIGRGLRIFAILFSQKIDGVLLFSSSGLSFIEKGTIGVISKLFFKKVIIFPRSGFIIDNLEGSQIFRLYFKIVVRMCDSVICQSNFWKEKFSLYTPRKMDRKFHVIENWLPDSYWKLPQKKMDFDENRPLKLVYFNRIEKEKGIYDFLETMKILQRERISVTATIYGDGREQENVIRAIASEPILNTTYGGWLSADCKQAIQAFDLCVFTSHREGFPNALLEGMAYGVPHMATTVGSVNDLIISGYNGVLVEVKSPEQMANAIRDLVKNKQLLQIYSTRSLERISSKNTLSSAVYSFAKLFERVL
ncbi:MAG: glycosyltransferase family 4 protein [Cyclobacteriaceae bacterium]